MNPITVRTRNCSRNSLSRPSEERERDFAAAMATRSNYAVIAVDLVEAL